MKNRIRELAEQAGLESQPAKLKIYKNDDGTVTSGGWEYPVEKFAELIIRECAKLNFRELGLSGSASFDVSRMIKQHFGVEE